METINYSDDYTMNTVDYYDIDSNSGDMSIGTQSVLDDKSDTSSSDYYDYYYMYYENTTGEFVEYEYDLLVYDFEVAVLGYVRPALIILTTLANLLVVAYFLGSKNRGKSTSLLFISIAISDTLTGLVLLPNSIYIYALDHEALSAEWCRTYMYLRLYFSQVLHTVSIWQTVLLGLQRYLCVCHPFFSGRICTFWKTFVAIVVIYGMAFIMHIYHLIDDKLGYNQCRWKTDVPCNTACTYLWFCIALMHFLPCLTLIYLTTKTLRGLNKARRRVSSMGPGVPLQRSTRDRIITITATLVVIIFLIPEIPYCAYRLAFVIRKHMGSQLDIFDNHVFFSTYEIALIIGFHCNFWVYCIMMRDFRQALHRLATCGCFKRGITRLRTFSRSSRSSGTGSAMTSISRTSSVASRHRILSNVTSVQSVHSDASHVVVPLTPTSPTCNSYASIPTEDHADTLVDDVFV